MKLEKLVKYYDDKQALNICINSNTNKVKRTLYYANKSKIRKNLLNYDVIRFEVPELSSGYINVYVKPENDNPQVL